MEQIEPYVDRIRTTLQDRYRARESALALSRECVRASANAIRAIHRHDYAAAEALIATAGRAIGEAGAALAGHPEIFHAGFVADGQKEYAEASVTLAIVRGDPVPGPADLGVMEAAYLNGLAEAVGELRRHLLDYLRRGQVERCEELLRWMDDIYGLLVTVDFPDAMTGGLRRSTDNARGILERTRGDMTFAVRQRDLEARLAELDERLGNR